MISPDPPRSVFSGRPVLLFRDCDSGKGDTIEIEYTTSNQPTPGRLALNGQDKACGETLRLLLGSHRITDAEARLCVDDTAVGRRPAGRQEEYLAHLSREYSLASRSMSLVAVVERTSDPAVEPPITQGVPVGLPQNMEMESIAPTVCYDMGLPAEPSPIIAVSRVFSPLAELRRQRKRMPEHEDEFMCLMEGASFSEDAESPAFERLMELSIQMEPDGGMPGENPEERILHTLLALMAFLEHGHDLCSGTFRAHMVRMLEFLERELPAGLSGEKLETVQNVLTLIKRGKKIPGACLERAVEQRSARRRGRKERAEEIWKELGHRISIAVNQTHPH